MAEFVGGKSVVVDIGEPITFENKTDTDFGVSCGVVFRKNGLYRVSVDGQRTSVSIEPERKKGRWIERWHENKHVIGDMACSVCGAQMLLTFPRFCPHCGAEMRGEEDETDRC